MQLGVGASWCVPPHWGIRLSRHAVDENANRRISREELEAALRGDAKVIEAYNPQGYRHWNYLLLCLVPRVLHICLP
jgi:hypothetical protein